MTSLIAGLYLLFIVCAVVYLYNCLKNTFYSWVIKSSIKHCVGNHHKKIPLSISDKEFDECRKDIMKEILNCENISMEDYSFIHHSLHQSSLYKCKKFYNSIVGLIK